MNSNAKQWVAALRDPAYKQGFGYLHMQTPEGDVFCCLGVACALASDAGVPLVVYSRNGYVVYDDDAMALPPAVQDWLGLRGDGTAAEVVVGRDRTLTYYNDTARKTLPEIADIIEAHPEMFT